MALFHDFFCQCLNSYFAHVTLGQNYSQESTESGWCAWNFKEHPIRWKQLYPIVNAIFVWSSSAVATYQ